MKTCLINGCKRFAECRGLCHPCYQSAWKYVKSGSTTWKVLEAEGFALPVKSRGVEKGAFRKALEKEESLADKIIKEESIGLQVPIEESIRFQVPTFEPFEQGDYDPPDEAQTGCEPPEPDLQGVIETLDPSAPEPLSEPETSLVEQPDPQTVAASMTAIKEDRTQPIENFFRFLPDLHSGQEPG